MTTLLADSATAVLRRRRLLTHLRPSGPGHRTTTCTATTAGAAGRTAAIVGHTCSAYHAPAAGHRTTTGTATTAGAADRTAAAVGHTCSAYYAPAGGRCGTTTGTAATAGAADHAAAATTRPLTPLLLGPKPQAQPAPEKLKAQQLL